MAKYKARFLKPDGTEGDIIFDTDTGQQAKVAFVQWNIHNHGGRMHLRQVKRSCNNCKGND